MIICLKKDNFKAKKKIIIWEYFNTVKSEQDFKFIFKKCRESEDFEKSGTEKVHF